MFGVDKAKRLASAMTYRVASLESVTPIVAKHLRDMADQLAAATAEIERLTRERDDARAEWQGADGKADWYVKECERLRKLVGEACDIGTPWVRCGLEYEASEQNARKDADRLAAIRHDAGLEGE